MNGSTAANAALLDGLIGGVAEAGSTRLLVCPPFPYLEAAAAKLAGTGIALGAQTVSEHASGAYTGEVSAGMLRDVGCEYAIVGHSERRALFGESSATVAAKFEAALSAKLVPVLCVGETLDEREAGRTEAVVGEQLDAVLERLGIEAFADGAVIAYEPVWAIGTGRNATPDDAGEMCETIRNEVAALAGSDAAESVRVLYGGSVNPGNIKVLMAKRHIDGALVGGASLDPDTFAAVVRYWI